MYCAKLTIPKMSDSYKLYVYSSKNPDSINTIEKIRVLMPAVIIDEAVAVAQDVDGKPCYIVYDTDKATPQAGVTRIAPPWNLVPTSEYQSSVNVVPVNNYTYVNQVVLEELPIKYNGTMLYYSVLGVDEANNLITHLSKVNGVMIDSDFQSEGKRHLYSCDDYTGESTDKWTYVTSVDWNEEIKIGDITDAAAMQRFGIPMIETVPIFTSDDVFCQTRSVPVNNFMFLEVPNPWQRNNKQYNYREMKSYKLQNVCDEQYSDFSEPTYQSLLPVSIEKMLILRKTDPADETAIIPVTDLDADTYQIIRRDGIYYNAKDHRKLSLNKYSIPLEERTGIFSEASTQDEIKIQMEALPNHIYAFTIYLFDVYGNVSEPVQFVARTQEVSYGIYNSSITQEDHYVQTISI